MHSSDAASNPAPGFLVLLLAFWMVIWAPLAFGLEASASIERVLSFGVPAVLLLLYRVGTTGLGIAAGRALWHVRAGAPLLAQVWLVLDALGSAATFLTPYFPSNRVPGTKGPTLALLLAFNFGWIVFLSRSRRVRDVWRNGVSN